jgi:hypothetical protein
MTAMEIKMTLQQGLSLILTDDHRQGREYATTDLQKGFQLYDNGQSLAEEAVGFGVPVVKKGLRTIFAGNAEFTVVQNGPVCEATATFTLNKEEKISRPGRTTMRSPLLYKTKNIMAALIRRCFWLRSFLTFLSSMARQLFKLQTVYEAADFSANVTIVHSFHENSGLVAVTVDTSGLVDKNVQEVVVMNEQGAHYFNEFRDSSGTVLKGKEIGCWDLVTAEDAAFICPDHHLSFSLKQVAGARLLCGRELIGSRLAWAGFGYSFSPSTKPFRYEMRIERRL